MFESYVQILKGVNDDFNGPFERFCTLLLIFSSLAKFDDGKSDLGYASFKTPSCVFAILSIPH